MSLLSHQSLNTHIENLAHIARTGGSRGFTIVELLIVIVVIGILAAITIVAYTGIQNNARNSAYKSDAQTLVKVAEAVQAGDSAGNGGNYPTGVDTAALTTAFNSTANTKIPSGVAISRVSAAPTASAALSAADGNPKTYSVWSCTAGANIYYPVRGTTTTVATARAGAGCS